jgi:demethylmenaquinone methyltransferase/2-methoxy-6-polyprenyl-1,4-benzoquinol methylase
VAEKEAPGVDVQAMFDRIARRYQLMNRLMTFGRDGAWRQAVVRETALARGERLLDVASGTGDIALEAMRKIEELRAVGADFATEMMRVGRARPGGGRIDWCAADALALPFPDASFDAVTSGYLIRNVPDAEAAFREQLRVVKPGGKVVCLDTTPPPPSRLRPFILFYLRHIIPLLGRLVAGDREAYVYLTASTEGFKSPEELARIMREAGLTAVRCHLFMFNTMAVHVGERPGEP